MDSFRSRKDTVEIIEAACSPSHSIPFGFLQHKYPRIDEKTLLPVDWPADRRLEWNPPGHGDIYAALCSSGMLDRLLNAGIRYAFVSNIDNIGAIFDTCILGHFARSGSPFMMEVAERTAMDTKGGHVARRRNDGALVLRELAQCAEDDRASFSDIGRHRFFNTNNIWLDLHQLRDYLAARNGVMQLPLIKNRKKIDTADAASPEAIQLETAMGAVLSLFENAAVLCVPRERFIPVKKCADLLLLWSDRYELTETFSVRPSPDNRFPRTVVALDERYYSSFAGFKERFPRGAPSLRDCESFEVRGNVFFGEKVRIEGTVVVRTRSDEPRRVPDGAVLRGDIDLE
jgi:UTP--glucose-1-phosphate uridylyltransferase